MKELYRFRQFLTEGVTADEITSREYGQIDLRTIEDKYIEIGLDKSWWPRGHIQIKIYLMI